MARHFRLPFWRSGDAKDYSEDPASVGRQDGGFHDEVAFFMENGPAREPRLLDRSCGFSR